MVHLAAAVGVRLIVESPVRTIETNVGATELVLAAAAKKGKRVLVASTSEVYGKGTKFPFAEDDDLLLGPSSKGRWSYAASKLIDEFLALAYWKEKKLPTTVVRLFNTVGPRQTGRYGMVIPTLTRQALAGSPLTVYGTGKQSRCFAHVLDVVWGIEKLCRCEQTIGGVYNIGATDEISIMALAEKTRDVARSSSPISLVPYNEAYEAGFEDMPRRVPDISKNLLDDRLPRDPPSRRHPPRRRRFREGSAGAGPGRRQGPGRGGFGPLELPLAARRAIVVADAPSPHQNAFFDAVASLGEVELEVFFCRRGIPGRSWMGEPPSRAPYQMLREAKVAGWPTDPTLVPKLLRAAETLPILIGYYLPAMALSGLALGALERPWIFWTDTLKPPGESRATPWQQAIAGRTRRWFLDRSTACLTTGDVGRRSLLDNGVPDRRIFSLPFVVDADWIRSSVDAKRPEREAIRASLGVPPDQKLLLYVGQVVELKRLDLLIDALAELHKKGTTGIGALLVGEGPAVPSSRCRWRGSNSATRFGSCRLNATPSCRAFGPPPTAS